jgi:Lon protease-like protein
MPEDTWDLALFPLETVLFPGTELPLHIFEDRYRRMVNDCLSGNQDFGVLAGSLAEDAREWAMAQAIGTSARITHVERLDDGHMDIMTIGVDRFRVLQLLRHEPYLVGHVEGFPLEGVNSPQVASLLPQAATLFTQYLRMTGEVLGDLIRIETMPRDASGLAYTIAMSLQISLREKQLLLVSRSLPKVLWHEALIMEREITLLKRTRQIQESNAGYAAGPTGYLSLS